MSSHVHGGKNSIICMQKCRALVNKSAHFLSKTILYMYTHVQVPAALMNVIEEKSLKDTRNVNMFYLLFWSSLYQLLTVFVLFWTDLIPGFGYTNNIHEFGEK